MWSLAPASSCPWRSQVRPGFIALLGYWVHVGLYDLIWLVVWNHGILWLSIYILGISSSQLLLSPWFFRGVSWSWSHQPVILPGYYLLSGLIFKQTWSLGILGIPSRVFPGDRDSFVPIRQPGKTCDFFHQSNYHWIMVLLTSDRIPKTRCFFAVLGALSVLLSCFVIKQEGPGMATTHE